MAFLSFYYIHGHSMEPTLKNASLALISNIPYLLFKPKVGEIAAFYESKKRETLIKRIKEIKENLCYFAGDNEKDNLDSKSFGWIEKRDIIGKVIFSF